MTFLSRLLLRLLGLGLLGSGVAMTFGGQLLTTAGGTPYYLVGGVALCLSGLFIFFRRVVGLDLYAVFVAATLAWAWLESGPNLWALVPRLDIWVLLGLLLAVPVLSRAFVDAGTRTPLILSLLASIAFGAIALVTEVNDSPVPVKLGVPSLGGMVTTDSGVAFMAGALDNYLRAYNTTTGEPLWEARLPAGGQAKPALYSVDGRRYVVVAAGGHQGLGTTTGDAVVAFALPDANASAAETDRP